MIPQFPMKRFILILAFLAPNYLVLTARAAEIMSASTMESYYAISEALAADSLNGVEENARKFAASVQDPTLQASATSVAAATMVSLEKTREMFKSLSLMFAGGFKSGAFMVAHGTTYLVHCPMKDADWLQPAAAPVHNPYHGSEMLECGGVMASYGTKP